MLTIKHEKVYLELKSSKGSSSSHISESRVYELESELKRLKLALYEMKETHEHDENKCGMLKKLHHGLKKKFHIVKTKYKVDH
jgi:hypothetical protein